VIAPYRSSVYTIWRTCERFGILPKGIKTEWINNNSWGQAQLIAYEQIRNIEENEKDLNILRALGAKIL
jgi:hypothetical protein